MGDSSSHLFCHLVLTHPCLGAPFSDFFSPISNPISNSAHLPLQKSTMACWLLLYFRKKAYKRRVSQSEYGPETHKKIFAGSCDKRFGRGLGSCRIPGPYLSQLDYPPPILYSIPANTASRARNSKLLLMPGQSATTRIRRT